MYFSSPPGCSGFSVANCRAKAAVGIKRGKKSDLGFQTRVTCKTKCCENDCFYNSKGSENICRYVEREPWEWIIIVCGLRLALKYYLGSFATKFFHL